MLKKGDVIFIVDDSKKNISRLSIGYGDLSYYHCALYIGDGKIIESVAGDGVIVSDLSIYSDNKKLIARTNQDNKFIKDTIDHAHKFIGYKYNDLFLPNTKGCLYCSELIHSVFTLANGANFFKPQKLNYISPIDAEISQNWIDFYEKLGLKVPQGEDGSHPNNLSLDERFSSRFFL